MILGTGYSTQLNFLSPSIKEKIEYDETQQRQPFILFYQMMHPDLQNMIFVGVIKGSQIKASEVQARFAISVITKKAILPTR